MARVEGAGSIMGFYDELDAIGVFAGAEDDPEMDQATWEKACPVFKAVKDWRAPLIGKRDEFVPWAARGRQGQDHLVGISRDLDEVASPGGDVEFGMGRTGSRVEVERHGDHPHALHDVPRAKRGQDDAHGVVKQGRPLFHFPRMIGPIQSPDLGPPAGCPV